MPTYSREHLLRVRIFQTPLVCPGDGCPKNREKDDIVGVSLEDILQTFLGEGHAG